eukprot:GFUD01038608.1.p1 GENE.GFUD01038608.1~~GFUD01038608.1.p1  ORF type:complete len:146 (-),score=43.27 GFUD01038608.1:17-454(-)
MSYRSGRAPVDFSFLDHIRVDVSCSEESENLDESNLSEAQSSEYDLSFDVDDAQIVEEPCPDQNHEVDDDDVTAYIERRIDESILARQIPLIQEVPENPRKNNIYEDTIPPKVIKTELLENSDGHENMTIYDMTGMNFVVESENV